LFNEAGSTADVTKPAYSFSLATCWKLSRVRLPTLERTLIPLRSWWGERHMQAKHLGTCQADAIEQLAKSEIERVSAGWIVIAPPPRCRLFRIRQCNRWSIEACAAYSSIPAEKRRALLRVAVTHGAKSKPRAPAFSQRRSSSRFAVWPSQGSTESPCPTGARPSAFPASRTVRVVSTAGMTMRGSRSRSTRRGAGRGSANRPSRTSGNRETSRSAKGIRLQSQRRSARQIF
jgi:hypothetical protein